jgi:hypothetical protein
LLDGCINLQMLSIRHNNLIDVPTFGIASESIESLDISYNPLLTLNLESFRTMIRLKILYVACTIYIKLDIYIYCCFHLHWYNFLQFIIIIPIYCDIYNFDSHMVFDATPNGNKSFRAWFWLDSFDSFWFNLCMIDPTIVWPNDIFDTRKSHWNQLEEDFYASWFILIQLDSGESRMNQGWIKPWNLIHFRNSMIQFVFGWIVFVQG